MCTRHTHGACCGAQYVRAHHIQVCVLQLSYIWCFSCCCCCCVLFIVSCWCGFKMVQQWHAVICLRQGPCMMCCGRIATEGGESMANRVGTHKEGGYTSEGNLVLFETGRVQRHTAMHTPGHAHTKSTQPTQHTNQRTVWMGLQGGATQHVHEPCHHRRRPHPHPREGPAHTHGGFHSHNIDMPHHKAHPPVWGWGWVCAGGGGGFVVSRRCVCM